jgi:Acetyltransferase (GNAT) domain
MNNIVVKTLAPEEYHLLEEFCIEEEIDCPSPDFSWVEVGIDTNTGKIIGIVVTQMLIHTEPILLKKEYQGKGIKEMLMDSMEGRLDASAIQLGKPIHVYNQPTNVAAERICRQRGYVKSDKPLYNKIYDGSKLAELLTKGDNGVAKE